MATLPSAQASTSAHPPVISPTDLFTLPSMLAQNVGTERSGEPIGPAAVNLPQLNSGASLAPTAKSSWSDIVQGANKKMTKKGESFILDSGEKCVTIPNTVIERNRHRWEEFILAQFHGKAPSPGALHAITNSIWSSKLRNISVSKLTGKSYLIRIPCPQTRKRVLSQGMWHIEKQSMFVAKWEPGLQPELPELTSALVWLEFRNVPPQFYSEEALEHIAGLVGDPLFLHPNTANMLNLDVARVFTIVDPSKALPEAVNVRFESGHTQRIDVSCPWLPPTCEHYNEVGHSIKRCPTAPVTCTGCQSTGHKTEQCPRAKKEHKKQTKMVPVIIKEKEKVVTPTVNLLEENDNGIIVIDIGLDKLNQVDISTSTTSDTPKLVQANGSPLSPSPSENSSDEEETENSSESSEEEEEENSLAQHVRDKEEVSGSEENSIGSSSFLTAESKKSKKKRRQAELKKQAVINSNKRTLLLRGKSSKQIFL